MFPYCSLVRDSLEGSFEVSSSPSHWGREELGLLLDENPTQRQQISGSYGIYPKNGLPTVENYELSIQRQLGASAVASGSLSLAIACCAISFRPNHVSTAPRGRLWTYTHGHSRMLVPGHRYDWYRDTGQRSAP